MHCVVMLDLAGYRHSSIWQSGSACLLRSDGVQTLFIAERQGLMCVLFTGCGHAVCGRMTHE